MIKSMMRRLENGSSPQSSMWTCFTRRECAAIHDEITDLRARLGRAEAEIAGLAKEVLSAVTIKNRFKGCYNKLKILLIKALDLDPTMGWPHAALMQAVERVAGLREDRERLARESFTRGYEHGRMFDDEVDAEEAWRQHLEEDEHAAIDAARKGE